MTQSQFLVFPMDREGRWHSNDKRYRQYASEQLLELESCCAQIQSAWPVGRTEPIDDPTQFPELWRQARIRDRTSDAVRIYAAMAIEGFLNFYGVLRLGQTVYDDHFERRLGLVPKLRRLLLVCDELNVTTDDQLCVYASRVAKSRNSLVHPRALEQGQCPSERPSTPVPEAARESVRSMNSFFEEFARIVPGMSSHIC